MTDRTARQSMSGTGWPKAERRITLSVGIAVVLGSTWLVLRPHPGAPAARSAALTLAPPARPGPAHGGAAGVRVTTRPGRTDPVRPVRAAYDAGRYAEAEAGAERVVRLAASTPTPSAHRQAAFARQILAYSAARRHDMRLARARFADLRADAATLPGGGIVRAPLGDPQPALVEEAAFQHAVCTGALGDTGGAETEYLAFMRSYPESPLVMAALKRLQRMHGGQAPPADESVWKQAMATARARQVAREREASLCGPECLAELLRRRGERADVHALAAQMGTGERGTTLAALAEAAQAHGLPARGLALTRKGLGEQRLPAVALILPGHYVLVEAVTPASVVIWDPDAHGLGRAGRRTLPAAEWGRVWQGTTLALAPSATRVQTASR